MCSPCIYVQKYENASVHVCGMQSFPQKKNVLKNACDNNAGKLFDYLEFSYCILCLC